MTDKELVHILLSRLASQPIISEKKIMQKSKMLVMVRTQFLNLIKTAISLQFIVKKGLTKSIPYVIIKVQKKER